MASPMLEQPVGRRERKKAATRDALQRAAFDLFASKGFHDTRISEIAEAADVSESTFFRYFDSKEGVALDRLRGQLEIAVKAVRARPLSEAPLTACLAVAEDSKLAELDSTEDVFSEIRVLNRYPELASSLVGLLGSILADLTEDFARRLGCPSDDLAARLQAHAVIAANMAVLDVWMADPVASNPVALSREALRSLQTGFGGR